MTATARPSFRVSAVLLDIEGTIASQSFVTDVLYPYTARRLPGFVVEHAADPVVAGALAAVSARTGDTDPVPHLLGWIAEDRKVPELKTIQGLIWDEGYRDRAFLGHIYEDAQRALEAWKAAGLPLYVYSSGSVHGQIEFFRHNVGGDLTGLFSGHWDTGIGAKTEAVSYARIVEQIGLPAAEILFLSDNPKELDAARRAGLAVAQAVREKTTVDGRFPVVFDFSELEVARV